MAYKGPKHHGSKVDQRLNPNRRELGGERNAVVHARHSKEEGRRLYLPKTGEGQTWSRGPEGEKF